MELAKLIVAATQAVIWPVTVMVVLLLFRRQIRDRLAAVTKAEFPGGVKLEIERVEQAVEMSPEITRRAVPVAALGPADDLLGLRDPLLAAARIRLEVENQVVRLCQVSNCETRIDRAGIKPLLSELHERGALKAQTSKQLSDYMQVTDRIIHSGAPDASDVMRSFSIGADLLAHLGYLYSVQYLLRGFESHGIWHMHTHGHAEEEGKVLWSAITSELPEFGYSYEAFRESAEAFSRKEKQRASELGRMPHVIPVPTLAEFVEMLEHRRSELARILDAETTWGADQKQLMEWQWPRKWGRVGWSGPILRGWQGGWYRSQAEEDLLRTEAAIEHYRRLISRGKHKPEP